jgi:hypothetical protein
MPFPLQHLHVEFGVVGNDDVVDVADQLFEARSYSSLSLNGGFVGNHFFCDVMNHHGINGNRSCRD